jgi:hypothetical protein
MTPPAIIAVAAFGLLIILGIAWCACVLAGEADDDAGRRE